MHNMQENESLDAKHVAHHSFIAALLSFFVVGLGQAYNGQRRKAYAFFACLISFGILFYRLTQVLNMHNGVGHPLLLPMPFSIFMWLYVFIWFLSIYDASRSAMVINYDGFPIKSTPKRSLFIFVRNTGLSLLLLFVICVLFDVQWGNKSFTKGFSYGKNGQYDEAIAEFNTTIKVNPYYWASYFYRGSAYASKGNFDQAIVDFNRAIQIKPDSADAYGYRANAYANKGNFDQAISDCNKALEIAPNSTMSFIMRGSIYYRKGDLNQAILDYNKAIKINPKDARAYGSRGYAYAKKGDLEQAFLDSNKVIEMEPNYARGYNIRGFVYYLQGKLDQAILDYNKAIEIKPRFAPAFYNRGLAYYSMEQYDKALADYRKAIKLKPDDKEAYKDFIQYIPVKKPSDTTDTREVVLQLFKEKGMIENRSIQAGGVFK